MNEELTTAEPATAQERTDTDEALGSAISSAIIARVDAPVTTPPVSLIAERAQAQARARGVQRTMVSIAASITLLAGGLVAYNAFADDDSKEIVTTDPAIATTAADPDSGTASAADPSANPNANQDASQDELPPLAFDEYDPAELFGGDFDAVEWPHSVGDGRVAAQAYDENGVSLVISGDGEDWTRISLPDGASPDIVDLSGPRWLITTSGWDERDRSFFSDDEGASWSEVDLSAVTGRSPTLIKALASGEKLLFIFKGAIDRAGQSREVLELISRQGLLPADAEVGGWEIQGTTLCFVADTPDAQTFDLCGDQDPSADTTPYKFELSEQELDAIAGYRAAADQIQIFVSDGGPATLSAAYESWHTTADSDSSGFYIAMTTPTDELLIASDDGFEWTETSIYSLSGDGREMMAFRTDDWFVSSSDQGLTVQSLARLADGAADAITIPAQSLWSLQTGPSAMAAIAHGSAGEATDPTQGVQLIGWSRDGRSWNLRSPSEVFGIGSDSASITLAVGSDYVLAHVTGFEPAATDEGLVAQPPKWFKANIE
ncbi:MAG: hypothetical protein OXF75_07190 [Acidimicrobiaceae bacterium]|nr:hypothetical protein [Acidimicrobiaceae bacterium]